MTADAATIRAAIDAYAAAFSAGDREAYLGCFADDAWIEDPVGSPVRRGRDDIGAFFDEMRGMSDSTSLVLTGPVRVAAGEAAFPMQARPRIGESIFVMDIIDVMTFGDDGRITSMRAFWDAAEMRPVED